MRKITLILLSLFAFVGAYAEDYCKAEGVRGTADRIFDKLEIKGGTLAGEELNFISTFTSTQNATLYQDRTSEVIEVSQGDELILKMTSSTIWMYYYGYIDYNNDKTFNIDGGEMIFSLKCNDNGVMPGIPTVKIPDDAPLGTTRFRFKSEWNSNDPCGDAEQMAADRGIMIDYTININPRKTNSSVTIGDNIEHGMITLSTEDGNINSGDVLAVGTVITVNAIPEEGFKLSEIFVNGKAISGTTFTLGSKDVVVTAVFVQNEEDVLTITETSHGTIAAIMIDRDNVETPIASGDLVKNGSIVKLVFTPEEQYILGQLTIKGINVTAGVADNAYTFTMNGATTISAVFQPLSVNYCIPGEGNSPGTVLTNTYLESVTSTGGIDNLNYSASSRNFFVNAGTISAIAGNTVTVELKGKSLGAYSETIVRQDLRYTTAALFIDWNQDGDFEYSQRIAGKFPSEGLHNVGGNYDVLDITKDIEIPANVSGKVRVRVVYHNAWDNAILSKVCGPVKEGAVCDFDIAVKSANFVVKLTQPALKVGSFKLMNGEVEVISGMQVAPGTVLTVVPNLTSADYKVNSILVNGFSVEGTEVTVTEDMNIALDIWNLFTVGTISHGTVIAVTVDDDEVETLINSGDYLPMGEMVKVTFTPAEHYLFETMTVNNEDITADVVDGMYTFVMNDFVTIGATFKLDPQYVTYCDPVEDTSGSAVIAKDTFLESVTSTGGSTQIEYNATSRTFYTYLGVISAVNGETVTVNFKAKNLGEYSTTVVRQDMRYTAAALFIDWNQDGDFSADESERVAGKITGEQGFHNVGGNMDVLNIIKPITIPMGVKGKVRARMVYNNAWMGDPLTKACNSVKEGAVYDFDFEIDAAMYNVGIVQPAEEMGSFKVMKGDKEVLDGTEIPSGTVLTVVPALASDEYEVRSVLVDNAPIEGYEVVVRGNIIISLDIIKGRTVTYATTGNGNLIVTDSKGAIENNAVVLKGTNITIKATPATGSHIVSVIVNGEDKTMECTTATGMTIAVNQNVDIQAEFAINTHKVTYTCNEEMGRVTVTDNGVNVASESLVDYGKTLVVTLNPTNELGGYVKVLKVNGVDKTAELLPDGKKSFEMTVENDVTIEALFDVAKYHLTCKTPEYGTIVIKDGDDKICSDGDEITAGTLLFLTLTANNELVKLVINDGNEELDYIAAGYVNINGKVYTTDLTAYGDVNIEATFKDPVGFENINFASVNVYVNNEGDAIVEGVQIGTTIRVYDAAGCMIAELTATDSKETVNLPQASAVYMIQIVDTTRTLTRRVVK